MNISDEYHIWYEKNRIWEQTKWLGIPIWKLPMDAFIIQDIIFEVKPDYIIETGTALGGSAMFYASILQLLGHGEVITIDIKDEKYKSDYKMLDILSRITFILGSSIDEDVIKVINSLVSNKRCLIILDSWHSYDHVLKEMEIYSKFVSIGSYMIVEDTHVSSHPINWSYGKGPYEAVDTFLKNNNTFIIDKEREIYNFTFNPSGYLKKV